MKQLVCRTVWCSLLVVLITDAFPTAAARAVCGEGREESIPNPIIFRGEALAGPATSEGLLFSPALFRVLNVTKGDLPERWVLVNTAFYDSGNGVVGEGEDGIRPSAGETWKIVTTSDTSMSTPEGVMYNTSICAGSAQLDSSAKESEPGPSSANHSPDPVVPVPGAVSGNRPEWSAARVLAIAVTAPLLGVALLMRARRTARKGPPPTPNP